MTPHYSILSSDLLCAIVPPDNKWYPGTVEHIYAAVAGGGGVAGTPKQWRVKLGDGQIADRVDAAQVRPAQPGQTGGVLLLDEAYDLGSWIEAIMAQ